MLNYHHGIDTKEFQRVIIAVQKKWIGFHLQPKGKCRITWEVVPQKTFESLTRRADPREQRRLATSSRRN